MSKLIWIVCAVSLVACSSQPKTEQVKQLPSEIKRTKYFQSEVHRIREQYGFPGITAAYVLANGTSGTASSGWANIEAKEPMTDNSRMLAASVGKSFVGAVSAVLASEKKLSLDEPVSRWLGKFDWFTRLPNHESMTLRHLLTHSAGLPDHVHTEAFQKAFAKEWRASKNSFPPQRLVEFVLDKPALFPAGQGWSYSDTGFILAGMVIEEATGNTYYDEIRTRLLDPLRLSNTSPANRRNLNKLAIGYVNRDNPFDLPEKTLDENGNLHFHPGIEWTGGGLVSTSRDLAHWGAALFTGKALSGDYLLELLHSIAIDSQINDTQYGAGVAIYISERFGPVYGHAGWIPGYISSLRHYHDSGATIAFQINTDIGVFASDDNVSKKIEERLAQIVTQNNE